MVSEFINFGILKSICHAICTVVHRVTVGWCLGGCCGGRMYYPKTDYLEKVINFYLPDLRTV